MLKVGKYGHLFTLSCPFTNPLIYAHTHTYTHTHIPIYKHIPLLVSLENVNEYSTVLLKFICWWTLWLFKVWGHYKKKKLLTFMNTSLWRLFISPGQIHRSKVVGLCKCLLNFIRNCQSVSSVSVLFAKRDGSRRSTSSIDLFSYPELVQWHFTTVLICFSPTCKH